MATPTHSRVPATQPTAKNGSVAPEAELVRYIALKLAALGHPKSSHNDSEFLEMARPLLRNYHQKDLMLGNPLCPADQRIQDFLDDYLIDTHSPGTVRIPGNTFLLDRPGLARVMSLPPGSQTFSSPHLQSYRVPQGLLHNPRSD